jgi:hypothetical chaperone protein
MATKPSVFAIDFGTSNSLLAAAAAEQVFEPAPLDPESDEPSVFRSVFHFAHLDRPAFGVAALKSFVHNGFSGRLIRSIKRQLSSETFTATRIGDRYATIEELIAPFLRTMRERASRHYDADVARAVIGRPALFSNEPSQDALAERRLRRAAELAGFSEVRFCPEPVAAAYDFAEDLYEPRLVLVADLGGGTSDFTVVRMSADGFSAGDVLGVGGVSAAGDALDGALVRSLLAPYFGSRVLYRAPFGSNLLEMPRDLVELVCSPSELTLVDRASVARRIADIRAGVVNQADRVPLERLAIVIEDGAGFQLYDAVEAAKRRLSEREQTEIAFDYPGAELREHAERAELEAAGKGIVQRILHALDQTLLAAGIEASQVEIACLTGGTSRVPMLERSLRERLSHARFRRLRSFHSVVQGLARYAREIERTR